jgi:toxin-antitoxin system PIN domain toxin
VNLLDVNVLIALADPLHTHRDATKDWFRRSAKEGWATCPLTENAFVRILGQPAYPNGPQNPIGALQLLRHLTSLPGHQFWDDAISLTEDAIFKIQRTTTARQLTDAYLLGLAASRGDKLITLDQRIDPKNVANGTRALVLLTS